VTAALNSLLPAVLVFAALAASNSYQAVITRVIDGDTVELRVVIWPQIETTARIRLLGVDAPELKGKCADERKRALEAKAFLEKLLPVKSRVEIKNVKPDKYAGRYDAVLWTSSGESASEKLIVAGLARPYNGEKRHGWC